MGDVLLFDGITRHDLSADLVLQQAVGHLQNVVILGYDQEGLEYFASSIADGGTVLWLIERSKLQLLRSVDPDA